MHNHSSNRCSNRSLLRRHTSFLTVILVLAVASAPVLAEDLTLVTTVSGTNVQTDTATQYVSSSGKVRSSDGQSDVIVHYDGGRIVTIDHAKKRYTETTLEEMRAQFAELEEMLESNPMMANMFGGGEVKLEKTGQSREIAGYETHQYVVTLGSNMRMEVWAAPAIESPVSYLDARKMIYAGMGPIGARYAAMFEALDEVEGFPLATNVHVDVMGMKVDSKSEATEVRMGAIDPSVFEPPAGYKQQK